jgi:transposase
LRNLTTEQRDILIAELRKRPRAGYRTIAVRAGISQNTIISWARRVEADKCACGKPIHFGDCLGKHAPATKKTELAIIAERVERDADTITLALKYNLHPATVYRILRHHPVKKRRRRPDAHTWTAAEDEALTRLWPSSPRAEIRAELPERTDAAIERHASDLGLRFCGGRSSSQSSH